MEARETVIRYEQEQAIKDRVEKDYKEEKNYIGINWAYTEEDRRELKIRMEQAVQEAQAEISFKAGEPVGYNRGFIAGREHGKLEGIREVVEWVRGHSGLERCDPDVMPYFVDYLMVDYPDWQDKLKEWGL